MNVSQGYDNMIEQVCITAGEGDNAQMRRILLKELPEVMRLFAAKSAEYGSTEKQGDDLGLAGQYSDLNRKMKKLKVAMWDGEPERLTSESLTEVVRDMIGHLLLTLDMIRHRDPQKGTVSQLGVAESKLQKYVDETAHKIREAKSSSDTNMRNDMFSNGKHAIKIATRGQERCHAMGSRADGEFPSDERLRCVGAEGHEKRDNPGVEEFHVNARMDSWR